MRTLTMEPEHKYPVSEDQRSDPHEIAITAIAAAIILIAFVVVAVLT